MRVLGIELTLLDMQVYPLDQLTNSKYLILKANSISSFMTAFKICLNSKPGN